MNLQIAYGGSRFVIMAGPYAFKFARFRPVYCIRRFFESKSKGLVKKRLNSYSGNPLLGGLKYVCLGIVANLTESRLSRDCPHLRIAPTLFSLLGFVNVQLRGDPVSANDLHLCPFQHLPVLLKVESIGDLAMCKQYARFPDGIRLIDYGSESVARSLRQLTRVSRLKAIAQTV